MQPLDVQQEYNRLAQAYRGMADEELEIVAAEAYDLTDVAREALSFELSSRGLHFKLNLEPPAEEMEQEPLAPSDDEFVPDPADLTTIAIVNDMQELLRVRTLLAHAKIESFLGDDNVRETRDLQDSFENGIEVKVWNGAAQGAAQLLSSNYPEPCSTGECGEADEAAVLCPKCKSDGVIFEERDTTSTNGRLTRASAFRWRCDDCGYEWEDDGVGR